MRVIVVVNEVFGLSADQTTASFAAAFVRRGNAVFVTGVGDLGLDPMGKVLARAREGRGETEAAFVASLKTASASTLRLGNGDLLLLRTNPGRGGRAKEHAVMLELVRAARDQGAVAINDPDALVRARSKLFLRVLPAALRPQTLVSRDPSDIRTFLDSCPLGGVLKPLDGTQGRDVFRVRPHDDTNLNQIIEHLTRDGHCMAQEFVPEAAEGDVRMIIVNGRLLVVDGQPAAVRRIPGGRDFRSNVHAGGRAAREHASPELISVAERAAPILASEGIFLCGLDVIGTKVVEANVFSPGGLQDAVLFNGVDFVGAIVDAFVTEYRRREAAQTLATG